MDDFLTALLFFPLSLSLSRKSKSAAVRDGAQAGNLSEADLSKAEALGFRLFRELKTTQLSELYELLPAGKQNTDVSRGHRDDDGSRIHTHMGGAARLCRGNGGMSSEHTSS